MRMIKIPFFSGRKEAIPCAEIHVVNSTSQQITDVSMSERQSEDSLTVLKASGDTSGKNLDNFTERSRARNSVELATEDLGITVVENANSIPRPVPLGRRLYFFPSPHSEGSDTCVIVAHAGQLLGDGDFFVPGSTEMQFSAREGEPQFGNTTTGIMTSAQLPPAEVKSAGDNCPNYSLKKIRDVIYDVPGVPSRDRYAKIGEKIQTRYTADFNAGCPHFVTIRNRAGKKTISLKETCKLIQEHDPAIRKIYLYACRGRHRSPFDLIDHIV